MKEKFLFMLVLLCFILQDGVLCGGKQRERNRRPPNIVLFITDDQDVMLGSMNVMRHTRNRITQKGVNFENAFTTTPMCCPSRSSILTGLYTHNHNVYTNNDNCSSVLWRRNHETKSYATYLNRTGYRTGYFGKYLNEYNGSYTPPGWQYWMGLTKNSKYYNYTLIHNGNREVHGDDYGKDYLTDLVTNRSMAFFRDSKMRDQDQPILSVVSFPAPHGPEDGAPQYQDLYHNESSHITSSFDHTPNPDKHWIIQRIEKPMDKTQLRFSNILQQKRLQTLRSVDDNIKKFIDMLQDIGELDNTYIMYFSDHGYHIGQFGLPKGKSMPYDFDIRIPFLLRGPGVPQNEKVKKIALNIDIAPTILGIARVPIPSEMDGRNLLELFNARELENRPWRDSFLVERGKMPRDRAHLVRPKLQKEKKPEKLKKMCALPNFQFPCSPTQFWTCQTEDGKERLQKCSKFRKPKKGRNGAQKKKKCPCPEPPPGTGQDSDDDMSDEVPLDCGRNNGHRRKKKPSKRNMFRRHSSTIGRSLSRAFENYKKKGYSYIRRKRNRRSAYSMDFDTAQNRSYAANRKSMDLTSKCSLYMPNFEIRCVENLFNDPREWMKHMGSLARSVKTLQVKMKYMKTLRSCLNSYGDVGGPAKQVPMCDCPPEPTKSPKPKQSPSGNSSHPLSTRTKQNSLEFEEQLKEYEEQKETRQMIKEMRQAKLAKIARRAQKGTLRQKKCGEKGVTCFRMTNSSWKTEPFWNGPEQCYCTNSNNNTYWCIRIINETTNALYCEFITHFVEYYDLNEDPHQLVNYKNEVSEEKLNALHDEMAQLRGCKGYTNCTINRSTAPPGDGMLDSTMAEQDDDFGGSDQNENSGPISARIGQIDAIDFPGRPNSSRKNRNKPGRKNKNRKSYQDMWQGRGRQMNNRKRSKFSRKKQAMGPPRRNKVVRNRKKINGRSTYDIQQYRKPQRRQDRRRSANIPYQ